jgi:hypothetical protein
MLPQYGPKKTAAQRRREEAAAQPRPEKPAAQPRAEKPAAQPRADESPPQSGLRDGGAAQALFAAIGQIGVAMRESQEPVAELGSLLTHLVDTLGALRSAPAMQEIDDSPSAVAARGLMDQLRSDVFNGIQHLQFYDRMMQHLSHLQGYLIAVANELSSANPNGAPQEVWDELHARLRERLISADQRGLLDLYLTPDSGTRVSAQAAATEHASPGSVELF